MKSCITLIFSSLFFLRGNTQPNWASAFLDDSLCYKIWWFDNKMGGYDGFEFRKNGDVKLLNYEVFTGGKWELKGDRIFIDLRSRHRENTFRTEYIVKEHANGSLVLVSVYVEKSLEPQYGEPLHCGTVLNGNFTDHLQGHWEGTDESYLQIIPQGERSFEVILSKNNREDVERFSGRLDENLGRISLSTEKGPEPLTVQVVDGKTVITVAGKTYSRNC